MFKRIIKFDKKDWLHIRFLLGNFLKQLLKCDFAESKEAFYWVKLHVFYDSKRVN